MNLTTEAAYDTLKPKVLTVTVNQEYAASFLLTVLVYYYSGSSPIISRLSYMSRGKKLAAA